jgi:hypothetical protein
MNQPFWGNNPTVLFNKQYLLELFPTKEMNYNGKLNSITRIIILLTFLGFIFTFSFKILGIGLITIFIIYLLYFFKKKEGFQNSPTFLNPETLERTMKKEYHHTNSKNPFSNVLLPEIKYDRNRNSAPPSFNPDVYEDITTSTKQMIQELNPEIINTDKQLFGDLAENFMLDQSNRVFYSTANTRVSNDQGAYAKYLYGDMPSCKNNDTLECVKDSYRYTLY